MQIRSILSLAACALSFGVSAAQSAPRVLHPEGAPAAGLRLGQPAREPAPTLLPGTTALRVLTLDESSPDGGAVQEIVHGAPVRVRQGAMLRGVGGEHGDIQVFVGKPGETVRVDGEHRVEVRTEVKDGEHDVRVWVNGEEVEPGDVDLDIDVEELDIEGLELGLETLDGARMPHVTLENGVRAFDAQTAEPGQEPQVRIVRARKPRPDGDSSDSGAPSARDLVFHRLGEIEGDGPPGFFVAGPGGGAAQQRIDALEGQVQRLEETVRELQRTVEALRGGRADLAPSETARSERRMISTRRAPLTLGLRTAPDTSDVAPEPTLRAITRRSRVAPPVPSDEPRPSGEATDLRKELQDLRRAIERLEQRGGSVR